MRKILLALFLWPTFLFAQISDDFEDGDISGWTQSTSGRWSVSEVSSLNGTYSLHHIFDNSDAGRDQISLELPVFDFGTDSITWKFRIKHGYNPSSANNWSVFLTSNSEATEMTPSGQANGYVLGVNYTGSTDTLKFWKIISGSATEIFKTSVNWQEDVGTTKSPAIEVVRTKAGNWKVSIEKDGDFNSLMEIGSGVDESFTFSNYFGIYYEYSSSQDQQLWFDDFEVTGPIYIDNEPPQLDTLRIISSTILELDFSESLDSAIATNLSNYFIDKGIGNPDSVCLGANRKTAELFFSQNLQNKEYYHINLQNIEDEAGNEMNDTTLNFLYFVPEKYDVVINEIMADPTPPINLPEYEYIEIKNTTEFDIDLSEWKLKTGSTIKEFPNVVIDSVGYLILCSNTASLELSSYGNVIAFSSLSLPNDGTSIVILDNNNQVIDSINYTKCWYKDNKKEEGGWSLEKIDPLNNCSGITNWKASANINGGTPGFENSVFTSNIDNQAPQLVRLEIISSTVLSLVFDEPVLASVLSDITNYSVNMGVGNPSSILISSDFKHVELRFSKPFPKETDLTLTICNMVDACGNFTDLIEHHFMYYAAKPYDIVVNEIMANPEPVLGLPPVEYIELYNTTEYNINLKNWSITIGSSTKFFESDTIKAGDYLILCHEDAEVELQPYGNIAAFSSFSLTDAGQSLILRDSKGTIVSQFSYSEGWYQDDYKADGGWSLEQIDPMNPCGESANWVASESETGGTPGEINSVNGYNPDLETPMLKHIVVIDDHTIQLFFNESLDSINALQLDIYWVDQGIGKPNTIELVQADYKSLKLGFNNIFEPNFIYTLEISGGITDCSGNVISDENSALFALPELPLENDIVINEILFNPLPLGSDFVEIYNRSDKTIDLKDLLIASYDENKLTISSVENITSDGYLIFPGNYIVLTEDPDIVKEHYITNNPNGFIQLNDLPAFNDDKGYVFLLDKWKNIIDNLNYSDDMHFDLLATTEGVSLERINFERVSDEKTNWHSASELVGFATPGYENSQFEEITSMNSEITIEPEVFSPDNDGYEDFTNIIFNLDNPGYVANIKIFDAKGRLIRYLANNQLLGVDGIITWDGLDDHNQKAPVGIYVVFIELFDLEGNVKQYKELVIVAEKY